MTKDDVLKSYHDRIDNFLGYAYDEGYKYGATIKKEELRKQRDECVREKGDLDDEYAKEWDDYTLFYGWCGVCKKPHSGRWAHVWEYCPWCGAQINHKAEQPYLTGMRHMPELLKDISDMCKDINPEEIKSHDTEDSLKGWCGAWNRRMEKLIKRVSDSE